MFRAGDHENDAAENGHDISSLESELEDQMIKLFGVSSKNQSIQRCHVKFCCRHRWFPEKTVQHY